MPCGCDVVSPFSVMASRLHVVSLRVFERFLFFDDGGWEFIFVRQYVRLLPFTSGLIQ